MRTTPGRGSVIPSAIFETVVTFALAHARPMLAASPRASAALLRVDVRALCFAIILVVSQK
jgi:hypothetical protein